MGRHIARNGISSSKQIDFAVRFAEHFNDDVIKHCSHIDKGFKTCPRRWDNIKIKKYLSNYTVLKCNKGNACEIFERFIFMQSTFIVFYYLGQH